jgi:hypothetical protein
MLGVRPMAPPVAMPVALAISDTAAIIEDKTMKKNETRVNPVTRPPNQRTSPYAIRIIVKFLKMV